MSVATETSAVRRGSPLAALVRRGLLDRRRSPLTWGGSLGALSALIVAIYPSLEDQLDELADSYPQSLLDAFGIQDLSTPEQYLSAEMFSLIVPFAIAFYAIRSVARAIPGREETGGLDVLLSAPVRRGELVAAALVVTAVATAGVLAVVGALTQLAALAVGVDLPAGATLAGLASSWAFALFFAGVAMLAAGFSGRSAVISGVAAGALLTMYVLDLVGKLVDGADWVRRLSAWRYYGNALVDGLDWAAFAGLAAVGVLLFALGGRLFARRDVAG